MISVVSPIFNEEENIELLVQRVRDQLEQVGRHDFEYWLVENGSSDRSYEIIQSLGATDPRIRCLRLSRNFGSQGAILAGLHHARGEAIITMDGDLQHPPEMIPKMIDKWEEGYHVVGTEKSTDGLNERHIWLKRGFYRSISMLSDIHMAYGQSDFRLMDASVLEVLKSIPEKDLFLRGMVQWMGFRQFNLSYQVAERYGGEPKFSLRGYVNLAMNGIFSFSTVPLKLFLWAGSAIGALAILHTIWLLWIFVSNLISGESQPYPPGWATLTVSIMFLGAVQLLGIGILGEYLSRVYSQTKGRPRFIVMEKSDTRGEDRARRSSHHQ